MSMGLGIRDPVAINRNRLRYAKNIGETERYGESYAGVKRKMEQAAMSGNDGMRNYYHAQLSNRVNDNVYQKLSNMKGIQGRGGYRRRRRYYGRGMYMAGAVPTLGRGMYMRGKTRKKIQSGARWAQRQMENWAPTIGAAANLAGFGAEAASMMPAANVAHQALGIIGGRGAYNTLFPELGPEPVQYESTSIEHGNLCVTGSEKVADIFGNSLDVNGEVLPFQTFSVDLFPGNFQQLPKLAQHAADFNEYEFVQLIFSYKSTIPQNWSTEDVTTGKIIMATEMDSSKPVWQTYDELSSEENKTVGLITGVTPKDRTHWHGVECDPKKLTKKGLKFVRTKGLASGKDKSDYDLGRFQLGLFGTSENLADKMIGELWVQYKVHFKNHRTYSMLGYNIPQTLKAFDFDRTNISANGLDYRNANAGGNENTSPNAQATDIITKWKQCFTYDQILPHVYVSNTVMGQIELCDFNNIDVLTDCSTFVNKSLATPVPGVNEGNGGQQLHGLKVRLTFPSSLRGSYEIELGVHGIQLMPHFAAVQDGQTNYGIESCIDYDQMQPLTTGSVVLNHDILSSAKLTSGGISQQPLTYHISADEIVATVHIHCGQTVSTQENSVEILIPFLLTVDTRVNLQDAMAAVGNNGSADGQLQQGTLKVKQYNSGEIIGTKGFPYSTITV